eukprot:NODE_6493_length_842_cov_110.339360_g6257_i0.p1 GENE.NODE_6493_length_842_cov_110.339360_g6257_i0~~NODE_6493_length_842_cov_110.339360_g6257_i0.p1  ORF type:complete len:177 (-),score=24.11 NODE_6493_length_842_cov_110.339360_g6257_i0:250-780(-)
MTSPTMAQRWQRLMDILVPQMALRWVILVLLMGLYCLRVYLAEGFYIVTYGLGIYVLNLFIAFLSPQTDPDFDDEGGLPTTSKDDEFRPFVRKLPEFKFWLSICKGIVTAIFLTGSRAFDVPVYWPILLFYFIILFFLTMKKRIQHMIQHKYVPMTRSKPKVQPRNPGGKEFEANK